MLSSPADISVLAEAFATLLPAINRVKGWTLVVKYGGNAMTEAHLKQGFATDVVMLARLGLRPVVVHGGGPQIASALAELNKPSKFISGMRVTDADVVEVVDRVLGTVVNGEIAGLIGDYGGDAVGINGRINGLIGATPLRLPADDDGVVPDLGYVGDVTGVDTEALYCLLEQGRIPVVAPLGLGADGHVYNINADLVAGHVARALHCEMLVLLTNTPGLLDKSDALLSHLTVSRIDALVADGTIHGGMLPKVECATQAVRDGVRYVRIADGRVPHALMLEVLGAHGTGTSISGQ